MKWITDAVSGLVSPFVNYFSKKNTNKTNIKLKNIERLKNADDSLAEWEAIQAESGNSSWKDEYIIFIITIPVPTIFFAVMYSVTTGDPLIASAAQSGVEALKELIPNYNELLYIVCLAGIGIKAFKK